MKTGSKLSRNLRWTSGAGLYCLLSALGTASAATTPRKIAVLPTKMLDSAAKFVEPAAFDEALLAAVQGVGAYSVVGRSDMEAVLGFERQKDILGCSDTVCFAEIGGALGVEQLLAVQLARADSTWLVSAKVIDVKAATPAVVARLADSSIHGTTAPLLEELPGLMRRLLQQTGTAVEAKTELSDTSKVADPRMVVNRVEWDRCAVGASPQGDQCIGSPKAVAFDVANASCPSGWRLPTRQEVMRLLGGCARNMIAQPAIRVATDPSALLAIAREQDGQCAPCATDSRCGSMFSADRGEYWTSSVGVTTNISLKAGYLWRARFSDGELHLARDKSPAMVRCVRDSTSSFR